MARKWPRCEQSPTSLGPSVQYSPPDSIEILESPASETPQYTNPPENSLVKRIPEERAKDPTARDNWLYFAVASVNNSMSPPTSISLKARVKAIFTGSGQSPPALALRAFTAFMKIFGSEVVVIVPIEGSLKGTRV